MAEEIAPESPRDPPDKAFWQALRKALVGLPSEKVPILFGATAWMAVAQVCECSAEAPWQELSGGRDIAEAWSAWSVKAAPSERKVRLRNSLSERLYLWEIWKKEGVCRDLVMKEHLSPVQALAVLSLYATTVYPDLFRITTSSLLFLLQDSTSPSMDPQVSLSHLQALGWVRILPGDGLFSPTQLGPKGEKMLLQNGAGAIPQSEECLAPPALPEADPEEMEIERDPEPLFSQDCPKTEERPSGDAGLRDRSDSDSLDGLVVCEEVRLVLEEALDASRFASKDELPPSFLFYGPPGTGKTHAAGILAKAMGRELHCVTIPQILACCVGDSETNMAKHFQEAAREGALLFFDEADAFLHTRKNARHTWEITQVNNMLEMLDRRNAPVVFATNLESALDEAVRRRIQWFVEFPIPRFAERVELWGLLTRDRNLEVEEDSLQRLASLTLTGGLIKNAVARVASRKRSGRLTGTIEEALIAAGNAEVQKMGALHSQGTRREIGFSAGAPTSTVPKVEGKS
jgi:hypothetical protein